MESEGLIHWEPGVGVFAKLYTVDEIDRLSEIRSVLEGLAARRACENFTSDLKQQLIELNDYMLNQENWDDKKKFSEVHLKFHKLIVQASQSPELINLVERYHYIEEVLVNFANWFPHEKITRADIRDHYEIIEALETGDPDLAEKTIRVNTWLKSRVVQWKKKFGDGPVNIAEAKDDDHSFFK